MGTKDKKEIFVTRPVASSAKLVIFCTVQNITGVTPCCDMCRYGPASRQAVFTSTVIVFVIFIGQEMSC